MKNKLWILFGIFAIYQFIACNDFIEKDLKNKWVYAFTPQDFSVIGNQAPVFVWEKVAGATSYNLKLYETDPGYSKTTAFIVDTNVAGTQYTQTLKSGYYKWDIYAQNGSSRSGLSTFRFQIDSASDITTQTVKLMTPKPNSVIDVFNPTFEWSPISFATKYNIQVFEEGKLDFIGQDIKAPTTTWTHTFTKPGKYSWRVVAYNNNLSSPISEGLFIIDTSRIGIPVVIFPKNDTTTIIKNPVTFTWNPVATATSYYMEVTADTTLSIATDTTATILTGKALSVTYYKTPLLENRYWRVRAIRDAKPGAFSRWWLYRRIP